MKLPKFSSLNLVQAGLMIAGVLVLTAVAMNYIGKEMNKKKVEA